MSKEDLREAVNVASAVKATPHRKVVEAADPYLAAAEPEAYSLFRRHRLSQMPTGPSTSQASSTILMRGATGAPIRGQGPPLASHGGAYAERVDTSSVHPSGTCLIVGCGYVGVRLARRLAALGAVLALVRSRPSAEALTSEGIPASALNLDEGSQDIRLDLPSELHAVVYLAPPPGTGTEDLRLARFLEFLGAARPAVMLYVSTTGVYGNTGGAAVDEDSATAPGEDRSRRRLDAERRTARWCAERSARWVVFRVPAIYGPHRLPLDRLRGGEPVLRPEDSGPGNRIQVDDLVEACLVALGRPVAGVFNLTDGRPESMAAFTTRVARLAGLSAPPQVGWAEARDPEDGIRASLREMGLASPFSSAGR